MPNEIDIQSGSPTPITVEGSPLPASQNSKDFMHPSGQDAGRNDEFATPGVSVGGVTESTATGHQLQGIQKDLVGGEDAPQINDPRASVPFEAGPMGTTTVGTISETQEGSQQTASPQA